MRLGRSIAVLQVRSILLVTVQVELTDAIADALQEDLLARIAQTRARGLIIEISALEMVDTYVADRLATTGRMARLMGTESLLVGMRPEVAATLVRMGYPMADVRTASSIDEALDHFGVLAPQRGRHHG